MGFVDNVRASAAKIGPVTLGLIAATVVVSAIGVLDEYKHAEYIAMTPVWSSHPWTILTYPFLYLLLGGFSVIFFLCILSWLVWVGGSVERDLGPLRYGIAWLVFTVLPAIFILIGSSIIGRGAEFAAAMIGAGPLLQVAAMTVIWGFRNRGAQVMLFALLPLNGFWMAFLAGVIVFVQFAHPPLLGVFACLHLLFAYAFATDRIPRLKYGGAVGTFTKYKPSKAQIQKEKSLFDDVRKRETEREERERLRKLFEASFEEDDKK